MALPSDTEKMGTNLFSKDVKISHMFKMLKDLNINDEKDINILLLGESGIGKSTFVNAIANYLSYKKFKDAENGKLMVLIPTKFNITDKNYKTHLVQTNVGPDENECLEIGSSATQDVKTYVFPIGNGKTKLRIIDSPGIGDTRGLEQDRENCEKILAYLGELEQLHAICCMFATSSSRITIFFDYCLKEILSRLHTSASDNLIFLFTNSGAAHFTPGDTLGILREIAAGIEKQPPHIKIPLVSKNIFCFENDNFKYLAAKKEKVEFDDGERKSYKKSWNHSSKECWRMIKYIVGDNVSQPLPPHDIRSTVSINEARRLIVNLSMPLADISEMIQHNIFSLDRHNQSLHSHSLSINDMRKKLHIPVIDLDVTQLSQPVTVCASSKCAEMYPVGDKQKWNYKQRCHDPCYLTNVPREVVGAPELKDCAAMDGNKTCKKCMCDFSAHMHVYYLTKTVNSTIEDHAIKNSLISREEAVTKIRQYIVKIETRKREFENERQKVVKYMAQFAHFLQNNAIIKYNDSYEKYIKYMIEREKSLGPDLDPSNMEHLEQLLREYKEAKDSFDNALKLCKQNNLKEELVTADMIKKSIQDLYNLPHTGKKIEELVRCQTMAQSKEYKRTEYQHPYFSNIFTDDSGEETQNKGHNKSKPKPEKQYQQSGNFRGQQYRGRGRYNYNNRNRQGYSSQDYPSPPAYNSLHHQIPPHNDFHNIAQRGYHQPWNQTPQHNRYQQPEVEINIRNNMSSSGCGDPYCSVPYCTGYPRRGCGEPSCRDPTCQTPLMYSNSNYRGMPHGPQLNQQYQQSYPANMHQHSAPYNGPNYNQSTNQNMHHQARQGRNRGAENGYRGNRRGSRSRAEVNNQNNPNKPTKNSHSKRRGTESSNSAYSDSD